MHMFFEVRIRYEKTMENGQNKKVNEPYLVDALSFTEAEARIINEMTPFISGDFKVKAVKEANFSEIFFSNEESADAYFKARLAYVTFRRGKENLYECLSTSCRSTRCRKEAG